jgi:hypothetical protein
MAREDYFSPGLSDPSAMPEHEPRAATGLTLTSVRWISYTPRRRLFRAI